MLAAWVVRNVAIRCSSSSISPFWEESTRTPNKEKISLRNRKKTVWGPFILHSLSFFPTDILQQHYKYIHSSLSHPYTSIISTISAFERHHLAHDVALQALNGHTCLLFLFMTNFFLLLHIIKMLLKLVHKLFKVSVGILQRCNFAFFCFSTCFSP